MSRTNVLLQDNDNKIIIPPKEVKEWGYLILVGNGYDEHNITWNQYYLQNQINLKNDIDKLKKDIGSVDEYKNIMSEIFNG